MLQLRPHATMREKKSICYLLPSTVVQCDIPKYNG